MISRIRRWVGWCLLLLPVLALAVSANAPAPPAYFYCSVDDPPPQAVYVDILIPLSEQDEAYTPYNEKNEIYGHLNKDSPIVSYAQDGYRSLSFHYAGVSADPEISSALFTMEQYSQSIDRIAPSIKVALLDESGRVLQVSEAVSTLPPQENQFAREIVYTAGQAEIHFEEHYRGSVSAVRPLTLSLLAAMLVRMLLSIGIECLIALPFGLRGIGKIALINLATQLVLGAVILWSGWPYGLAIGVMEPIIYIGEGLLYLRLFPSLSKRRVLLYTVCANTVTLGMGLILNAAGLLMG